jgi:hypothetical protein
MKNSSPRRKDNDEEEDGPIDPRQGKEIKKYDSLIISTR